MPPFNVVANLLQSGEPMSMPGPEAKKIYARYYARFGTWGPGLLLILKGDPVPPDLAAAAYRLRKIWIRVETERELVEELNPPKRKTVTWINDDGEEMTIHGYEAEEEEEEPAPE